MLTSNNDPKNILETFAKLMGKRNINGKLKLLTSNVTNGILLLDEKTQFFKAKKEIRIRGRFSPSG